MSYVNSLEAWRVCRKENEGKEGEVQGQSRQNGELDWYLLPWMFRECSLFRQEILAIWWIGVAMGCFDLLSVALSFADVPARISLESL